jgi:hypothetical protein
MCVAVPVAMLIVSIASAVASAAAQKQQAVNQERGLRAQAAQQQNDLNRQQDQIDQQASQAMNEQARKAMHDMALFDTVTGEYGGGHSTDRASAVSMVQNGENLATLDGNRKGAVMENRFESLAVKSAAQARMASIQQPSWIETGLKIGSSYVNYKATGSH